MSSIQKKIQRRQERLRKEIIEKRKRKDALTETVFDFPNLILSVTLFTFAPAFLVLAILCHTKGGMMAVKEFAGIIAIIGFFLSHNLLHVADHWFKYYGEETIIGERIPVNNKYVLIFFLWSAYIIIAGFFISNNTQFCIYALTVLCGSVYMALNKNAILWDMPPIWYLGYKKYKFTPTQSTRHTVKNTEHHCVIRTKLLTKDKYPVEGTFIGKTWFILREKKEESEIESES